MSTLEALILGFIQGVTEFLPVSSSGHLVMAETLMQVPTPGVFVEVALHVATLLSVVLVYHRMIGRLLRGVLRREREALVYAGLLLLASVPAGVVGILFEDTIERAFDAPALTGVMLLVTGALLWSTRVTRGERSLRLPSWRLALGMGVAQAFAILPGISRSGATIVAGLWGRMDGESAAEFSFLMSIIAIGGAALLQVPELAESTQAVGAGPLLAGFAASLIVGVAAIVGLVWLLRRQRFFAFAYYVWAAGGVFLLYLALR